jgi:hypothetical protein
MWGTSVIDASAASRVEEWRLRSGNRISAPVIAGGRVFVADIAGQQIVALDENSGKIQWRFTAGGRIDAPPTIHRGLCLFGARDGYVYCVTPDSGDLVWRFRAAPTDRRIVAFGQLESVWPVSGTVLVQDETAYVAAGRTADADGGVHVWALDVGTGEPKWTQHITELTGLSDYLVASGGKIYLGNQEFDPDTGERRTNDESPHLRGGKAGLLETSWTQVDLALRKSIQDWTAGGASGQVLAFVPAGEGVVQPETPSEVFGYKTSEERAGALFASGRSTWSHEVAAPRQIRACLAASNAFVAAGANDHRDNSRGGFLAIVTKESGEASHELDLAAAPIVDGVAAAGGRLYVSLQDGSITCLGTPQTASAF